MNDVIADLEDMLYDDDIDWADKLGIEAAIAEIKRLRNLVRGVPQGGFDNSQHEE